MCNIEEPILVKEQATLSTGKKCIKCKVANATILIRYSTYCKSCFQHVFVGKFRKNLEKSRVTHSGSDEKAMVALSGGPSSRCLLQLLRDYCEPLPHEISKKSIFNEVKICHVDESVAIFDDQEKEKENSTLHKVELIARKYNYEFIGLRLEEIFSPEYTSIGFYDNVIEVTFDDSKRTQAKELLSRIYTQSSLSNREKLKSLLGAISSLTSKEELLWHFKLCLLMQMAHVIILRPMKDMLSKEIGIYNRFTGLVDDIVVTPTLTSMMPAKSSIEKLTEDFIVGLEKDYPSTVSTIARTGAKLKPSNLINLEWSCAVCMMPYKEGIKNWQSRITVHMKQSPLPSQSPFASPSQKSTPMDYHNSSCQCASNGSCCAANNISDQQYNHHKQLQRPNLEISDTLCYACLVNMRDIKSIVEFPPYVAEAIVQKIQKATNATVTISPTRLKSKFFATAELYSHKSLKTDYVGIPDKISNLRPIKYYIPENESPQDIEWRLHRERVDQLNHQFWTINNKLFIDEKQEYEDQIKLKTGRKPTPAEMSIFYKDFLDKAYDRQMAYNKQWWKENIGMLVPGGKAAIRNFRIWMPKRLRTRISFFEKNASS
ncbi:4106_t:CDS:10 [Ambispora leptoticha]|uniref:Cytoplasmic tRNA 2-thiolation protein 2 n=1 Tax=Ambispora leptoticha TaxID=144679 RepID=A0A9N8W3H0_9GLOM|nr:4106_t:CDS:10 [Ambispora leptoticha]